MKYRYKNDVYVEATQFLKDGDHNLVKNRNGGYWLEQCFSDDDRPKQKFSIMINIGDFIVGTDEGYLRIERPELFLKKHEPVGYCAHCDSDNQNNVPCWYEGSQRDGKEELVVEIGFNDGSAPCLAYRKENDEGMVIAQQYFRINFCPMCGRKLTEGDDAEKNEMEARDV